MRRYVADLVRDPRVIAAELAVVDARIADAIQRAAASPIASAPDPGAAFLDAPVDIQRAVLAAVLRVEVLPAPRRGGAWSPERLRLSLVSEAA